MTPTVLVVDDDAVVAGFVERTLRLEGFSVRIVTDATEALAAVAAAPPDLVIADVLLPGLDGLELCRRLRAHPMTAHLPVIFLTARGLSADKVVGLAAGADDYVVKPFDTLELVARVRSTLRRNAEMRAVSPLTGLPGNHRIDSEIAERVERAEPFAVGYVDIDNFKPFNDAYGFLRGDEAIVLLAAALNTALLEAGEPRPFLGHVGGDDFVLVCEPHQAERMAARVLEIFDAEAPGLHAPEDRARGYLRLLDRRGRLRHHPLLSVSVGLAMSGRRRFADHREAVAIATEMKGVAKARPGSAVAVDRRADATPTAAP